MNTAKNIFALLAFVLVVPAASAQNQLWVTQFGTSGLWDSARALSPDGVGGVMAAGGIENAQGVEGPYLARYDSAGNQLWYRQFGTRAWDRAHALAPDSAGGVFVAGWTEGSLGGPSAGGQDAWIARYDGAGIRLWITQFGSSGYDRAFALAPDGAGGVMVAGDSSGNLAATNAGAFDVVLARYDSAGKQLWVRQFGTDSDDIAWGIASDGAGGLIVGGSTQGDLAGPNAGFGEDVFLARYDSQGNRVWIVQLGSDRSDVAWAVTTDGAGGAMVAGEARGDLGAPIPNLGPFLARYDGDGNQLWVRQFGLHESGKVSALSPDGAGGVIFAGRTSRELGGPSAGRADAYLGRYDEAGNQQWLKQFGTSESDVALAVAFDGAGGAVVGGWTEGNLGGPNAGERDVFLARYETDFCYVDCDRSTGNGVLDIFDFLCWQGHFVIGGAYACNCDTSTGVGVCDIFDFLCFQSEFVSGCP